KIYSKLKFLYIIIVSQDVAFLNARRWEQLILKFLPDLEKIYLHYYEDVANQSQYSIYPGEPNQFISSFWIDHQWIFEVKIIKESIHYSARPYKKRWFDYTPEKIFNSFELLKSTQLIVTDTSSNEILRLNILRVLSIVQIYHLEMSEEQFVTNSLFMLLSLLPELYTLKLYCCSSEEREMPNSDEDFMTHSINDTNKVTKLYLKNINNFKLFYFLLNFCRHLEYIEVDDFVEMDVKSILQDIVLKTNHDGDNHLHSVCFHVPTADDKMIKNLNKYIREHKLLLNFKINRVLDDIYITLK
ncbi:unnamed protein product, partial [Rotaria sp. Silwood2]